MPDQKATAEGAQARVRDALAHAPATTFFQHSFSLLALDFDEHLHLVSAAGVTREGADAGWPGKTGARLIDLFNVTDAALIAPLVEAALAGQAGMRKLSARPARTGFCVSRSCPAASMASSVGWF